MASPIPYFLRGERACRMVALGFLFETRVEQVVSSANHKNPHQSVFFFFLYKITVLILINNKS